MEKKRKKFSLFRKLDKLEVYLIAADNPIGKRQWRIIFRRKRSKEVLTREQVTAIKRGRRVLRKEMKLMGLKRREDFEVTAHGLGLYFDKNRLLAPILLWFQGASLATKILATTAVLTTLVTVTQPVIEYITEYLRTYVTKTVTDLDYLDKDRFTITVTDEMQKKGFELSETADFAAPQEHLIAAPVLEIPCVSIASIPYDVDEFPNNTAKEFLTYTFYCRYINKDAEKDSIENLDNYAMDYQWGLRLHQEGLNTSTYTDDPAAVTEEDPTGPQVSDAIWVMVFQDGEAILCAKEELDENGEVLIPMIPTTQDVETKRVAFRDRTMEYINQGLSRIDSRLNVDNLYKLDTLYSSQAQVDSIQAQIDAYFDAEGIQNLTRLILRTENWRDHYNVVAQGSAENYCYYQVEAEKYHDPEEDLLVERTRTGMLPWIDGKNEEYHKYTVVIWLEGDDPQCTNDLMDGYISLNFQIKEVDGEYKDIILTPSSTTTTIPMETIP